MTERRTAAVLGLGLIGGSVARDLDAAGWIVLGHDTDLGTLAAAQEEGVLAADLGPDMQRLPEAEWVVVAVPVDVAPAMLARIAPAVRNARMVTDVGSTKRAIVDAADRLGLGASFVGSHPLAGGHDSGWTASAAGLFRGATTFVTPTPATGAAALEAVRELWRICGSRTELLHPADHDRRLAWISHLPQLASSALALTLESADLHRAALGPGGRDLTRLAASSPGLWSAIALENADNLTPVLQRFLACLGEFQAALGARDAAAIQRLLERAHEWATVS